jgi:transposase-like protein
MTPHRIVSVEIARTGARGHESVLAVTTRADGAADTRWTLSAVLKAMNRAERFYTQAANGRQARVQRYQCAQCKASHIRTHVSDAAIDDVFLHRARPAAAP